ncbi:MAG: type II secretion system protein GspG [Acidobacteriota bacterium]
MRTLLLSLAVVACSKTAAPKTDDPARIAEAKALAAKYAFDAYPRWAAGHPDKACPAKIEDLDEYVKRSDANDPWGHPFKMMCGPTLPADARGGFAVSSAGPDGKDGTTDDIKSWEK